MKTGMQKAEGWEAIGVNCYWLFDISSVARAAAEIPNL
ncbi:hypothetical protein D1BOALGB6SA_1434 [Olavius sp. associated proteobacterium Delta 1]|nr:hypothetical protein D1BOALGB6SA_1434 [Olavius sp. associated proteobacterium Delta 1]